MRLLNKTVLAGGVIYPAGTPATPELEAVIGDQHWDGEPDYSDAPSPAPEQSAPSPVVALVVDGDASEAIEALQEAKPATDELADQVEAASDVGPADEDADEPDPIPDYSSWSKPDLESEVTRRNEGRDDDAVIVVGGRGNKPDLVAALEDDDDAAANA